MTAELPVIASRVEGLKDLVSSELLFSKEDAEDLAAKIQYLENAANLDAAKTHSKEISEKQVMRPQVF